MFLGRRVLVVIPARGGSKGVPLKNIRPLCGRPLISHVGDVLAQLPFVDRAVVSTEDVRIAEVAKAHGLDVPFYRPDDLGGDMVGDVPVLRHASLETERLDGHEYDIVIMLQPTCPLRTAVHVQRVIAALVEGDWDAAWSVSRSDLKLHPLKQLRMTDSRLAYYEPSAANVTARQQLEQLYYRNGAAYALTRQCLMDQDRLLGARTAGVVIEEPLVNIDTVEDFVAAETLLCMRNRAAGGEPR
jgi:CMP-N,N'-diacetyllegionaminic acid synthase